MKRAFPKVGIIGAGQLARMTVAPAVALGVDLLLFAQSKDDSAAQIAPHIVGDFTKIDELKEFARLCDVVTFEHELVPQSVILSLESSGIKVYPPSSVFLYSQDKEKMREKLSNFPSPKWSIVTQSESVEDFPVIAKAIQGGYDGRGVWEINSIHELEDLLRKYPKILVEEKVKFDSEIAVMVARSPHGQASTWVPTQTIQEDGICTITVSPAPNISQDVAKKAQELALEIAEEISLVGVMAVEMFVRKDELLINELAMRTHNSGHWTIEGSITSQFEQHLRAILDLPLGDPTMTAQCVVMGNILGGDKPDMYRPYLHLMARNPELKFHQYMKEVRKGRKIGHVTALGDNAVELRQIIEHAREYMEGRVDE